MQHFAYPVIIGIGNKNIPVSINCDAAWMREFGGSARTVYIARSAACKQAGLAVSHYGARKSYLLEAQELLISAVKMDEIKGSKFTWAQRSLEKCRQLISNMG